MGRIAVVTDSTSDLPAEMSSDSGVRIIPLSVVFQGKKYVDDGKSIQLRQFYRRLKDSDTMPMAAQPSPGDFMRIYSELLNHHDGVLSIHISGKLSGTCNSAMLAQKQLADPSIKVIDSGMVHMACGFMALEASRLASQGLDMGSIVEGIGVFKKKINSLFCPFTLDNLIKGGRLGRLQGVFANLLEVKPILTLKDGEVSLFKKTRRWEQAKDAIVEAIKETRDCSSNLVISVADVDAGKEADSLADRLMKEIKPQKLVRTEVGIVVGSHLGIGGLGITYHT